MNEIKVLDHGFIRIVDKMGSDAAIVQAARVSYGEGTKSIREDEALIRYLIRHQHTTPFEMCEIKFHCKMPIFVARQWIRHRTANVNEYSARYSVLPNEFYVPEMENLGSQSKSNRQGRGLAPTEQDAREIQQVITHTSELAYGTYERLLNESGADGSPHHDGPSLARELARMVLPTNYYTEWYWKIDLHNLLHFLQLRCDAHAQYEIRVYAEQMLEIVKHWVPLTHRAFVDYRLNAFTLSAQQLAAVKLILRDNEIRHLPHMPDMTAREREELAKKLGLE